jgi:hypothetical protein
MSEMLGNLLIGGICLVLGVLSGWGIPLAAKSSRPYGLLGDVLVCTVTMVVLGLVEWILILPAMGISGWLAIAAAIGDPWGLALILLWLMRRIKS